MKLADMVSPKRKASESQLSEDRKKNITENMRKADLMKLASKENFLMTSFLKDKSQAEQIRQIVEQL